MGFANVCVLGCAMKFLFGPSLGGRSPPSPLPRGSAAVRVHRPRISSSAFFHLFLLPPLLPLNTYVLCCATTRGRHNKRRIIGAARPADVTSVNNVDSSSLMTFNTPRVCSARRLRNRSICLGVCTSVYGRYRGFCVPTKPRNSHPFPL